MLDIGHWSQFDICDENFLWHQHFISRKIKAHFKNLEQNLNNTSDHNQPENIRLKKEVRTKLINLWFWVILHHNVRYKKYLVSFNRKVRINNQIIVGLSDISSIPHQSTFV